MKDKTKKPKHPAQEQDANKTEHETTESLEQASETDNVIDFEQKKTEKEASETELDKANKEIEDLKNTVKRTQADFMNYKRRTEEESQKMRALANENIIKDFLEVLDSFDRALDQENKSEESFVEGVTLIRKQIFDILKKYHVKEIPTDISFDPNFHDAVMQEEGEKEGEILEVFQKGYTLKDKVIRPSMVKVSN